MGQAATRAFPLISGFHKNACPVGLLPCQPELSDKTGEAEKAMPKETSEWKRRTEGILVILVGMVVGTIIGVLPGEESFPGGSMLVGWAVCAFGLSLLHPMGAVLGVGWSFPTYTMVKVAIEISQDPTSNNLWPIGLVIVLALTFTPAVVGAAAGWFLRRFVAHKLPVAVILVAASVVIVAWPARLASRQISINEVHARTRVTAILEAQRDYQSQDPDGRYACHFDDLNQTFERQGSTRRSSETGWANGYRFELSCRRSPQNTFYLEAIPQRTQWPGIRSSGMVYCTNQTGQIFSLPAVPRGNCWREGDPLSSR